MLKGPQDEEKEIESRLEEVVTIYCSTAVPIAGRISKSELDKLCAFADQSGLFRRGTVQQLWFPAYGLLPRWHHTRTIRAKNRLVWKASP